MSESVVIVTGALTGIGEATASAFAQGRAGKPEEVADAIVFMARSQATYLTGQTLFRDSGLKAG
jgi:NAD(P)-dependent dehydrogenase (short-subunit alcohol dehydrogenase family)